MALEILHPHWAAGQQVRGILFDMDGLVLDSEILYTRFWAEASAAMGHPMTRQQALGMRSLDSVASQAWLDTCFGPGVDYQEMHRIRVERMGAYVDAHGIALKPGIRELLDYLDSRDIPRAITSSSPLDRIRDHLSKHGLDTRFTALCSGRDVPRGKPEPDIYLHGAATLGFRPEECLAAVMQQILIPSEPMMASRTLTLLDGLLSTCRLWVIRCNISQDAAILAHDTILGESNHEAEI